MSIDGLRMATQFAIARWGPAPKSRSELLAIQRRKLDLFLRKTLPRAPYYQNFQTKPFESLPIVDKSVMMANFDGFNTRGIRQHQALEVALRAESSRDFSAQIGDLTVGMSSGTSGNRGIFLVSPSERVRWAGILLARALSETHLNRLLDFRRPPLCIAFILRANSRLYATLQSRRIAFNFHDVLQDFGMASDSLNTQMPDVLVAPPSALRALAAIKISGDLRIAPSHIISVADVLEDADAFAVREAFGISPHQLYQATEGFLGYTCKAGRMHLNERHLLIEPDWIDEAHTRFQPIITDFSRSTQLIVRYRLNDILTVQDGLCACGNPERIVAGVAGRSDDVLWLARRVGGELVPLFPDLIRRAMWFVGPEVSEYQVIQERNTLKVALKSEGGNPPIARVTSEFKRIWMDLGVEEPLISFTTWNPPPPGGKRKRIVRIESAA